GTNADLLTYSLIRLRRLQVLEPLKSPIAAQTVTPSGDRWATRLRGFGPFGILVMLVVPFAGTAFIGAVLVLVCARLSRTSGRKSIDCAAHLRMVCRGPLP